MTTYDNGQPVTPEWAPHCRCGCCHTCLPLPKIPDNIELGGRGD